ncbi:MAG: CPBP family intramembrane glutamic endopeptidase [Candidatus Thorarchaeota archaeon]|jgi:membrane protease YdiL (CAAX protease family)
MATTQIQETTNESELPASTNSWTSIGLVKLGGIMLAIAVVWRIIDQFVLGLGATWMNIFPSKLFPFLIILVFFWKYRQSEIDSVLGLSRERMGAHLALGLLIGVIIAMGIDFGGTIIYALLIDPAYPLQLHILNEGLLGYMFIFFLTNAFLEEALFRGLLINGFKTRYTPNKSILLSAVIFGIWHAGWPIINGGEGVMVQVASMVFFTTILGIFFGIYYVKFTSGRSLLGPIAVHTIINFVSECFKIGPEPVIQGPDLVFSNGGLMSVTLLMFLLSFIPLSLFLSRYKMEQVNNLWNRARGKGNEETTLII